jgi:hypothetical protein
VASRERKITLSLLRLDLVADLLKSRETLKYLTRFLVFLTLLTSCEGEKITTSVREAAYFPLEKGIFQEYSVHEVIYRPGEDPEELDYEMRTEVVDSFPSSSAQDQYVYVVHRSVRHDEGELWQPLDTWSVRKDEREIVVAEGNVAFVKMRFPLSPENTWDANVLNTMDEDEYALRDIHKRAEVNGISFEKTITVEQEANDDRIVFRDERKERYALGVGLVFREVIQLHYCTANDCLGQQHVDYGTEVQMSITDYGKR